MLNAHINKTIDESINHVNLTLPHVLEFGVYEGTSITKIKNMFPSGREIFGFDSFEGLPEDWVGTRRKKGEFSSNGKVPNIEGIKFYKGWFVDTIPQYIRDGAKPICLMHVDCDLYSSTKTILELLNDYIVKDTLLVFDEWYYNYKDLEENRQHEQKAFFEWVQKFNRKCTIYDEIEIERRIVKINE